MSHTLHRPRCAKVEKGDFVVLVMPARGINNTDVAKKYGMYADIFRKYNPSNMGGMSMGILTENSVDRLKELAIDDAPMFHAVFSSRADVEKAVAEVREKDYGFSVVVSGTLSEVREALANLGIAPHSYNFSLGVWGNKGKLPPMEILELTSMCGHSMISASLVKKLAEQIRAGKKTARKAAEQLSLPCLCGIFNVDRAEQLLARLAAG